MDNDSNGNNHKTNHKAKAKAKYVTKEQRKHFIKWYLKNYGMNDKNNMKEYNSRILSSLYYQQHGILIPKITIYRWITHLDGKDYPTVMEYASKYLTTNQLNSS